MFNKNLLLKEVEVFTNYRKEKSLGVKTIQGITQEENYVCFMLLDNEGNFSTAWVGSCTLFERGEENERK